MTSPITPTFDGFDVLDNSQRLDPAMFAPNPALFPTPDQTMKSYPVRTQEPNFRYPAPEVATNPYFQPLSPAIEQQPPSTRPSQPQLQTQHQPQQQSQSAPKPPSKKNTYPCPLSKEFSCNDFFTTSGHAARHAKKHTGRKDAICPDCNKAFTRKDNMEQHRRTHQNGRNVVKAGSDASSSSSRKPKPSSKRPKPASLHQSTAPLIDPTLPASPASSFGFNDVASMPTMQHAYPSFYQEPVAYPGLIPDYQRQPSFTVGLDALAIAATGDGSKRRKLDI
ncbi:hypothetical protein LTS18_000550 [Coniosporium uncinatum]|uniref:Uncharacterized protein n=1 Tax=Coniosporium uncinatum TaxID=93489 RepID=A0ACC3D8S4_9PEZI|nr:hypothetical protein LTS18_000550 [Coniosporium uncinatum]